MRNFQSTRSFIRLALLLAIHFGVDAHAASATKTKPASASAAKAAAQPPPEPSLCSNSGHPQMELPQRQLLTPGFSEDQSGGLITDSHQKPVMVSVLTPKQAEQLAKQLRRHHSEMGGHLNPWASKQLCDQRAYLMECYAQTECNISLGRVFIEKPPFPFSMQSSMKILNKEYNASIRYHTASLVYILDGNGDPKLHVIDPFANGAEDAQWTGAYTPVRYDLWTRDKIQAENWIPRFVPKFSAWRQLENTNAEPNVSEKCSDQKMNAVIGSFGPLVQQYKVMNAGTVK